jgi:hypothetical protein
MEKLSLRKAFSCAKTEYIKWVTNSRMIILLVMLVFVYNFAVSPVLENVRLMGEPINCLEPFLAVANSGAILFIIPLTFLALIADFPRIDTNTVFYICRIGRKNWLAGQILRLFMMVLTLLLVIFVGTVQPQGFFSNYWSNVVVQFAETFPELAQNFGAKLLPENLYNQIPVLQAAWMSYLFVFLYLLALGMLLLSFSILRKKTLGLVLCVGIITAGAALCSIKSQLMWIFPMSHAIIWLHYTKYYRTQVMPMWVSGVYFGVALAVLLIISAVAVRKFNYDNVTEIN